MPVGILSKGGYDCMTTLIRCFLRDDRGATSVEYALIAAGISTAIIGVFGGVVVAVKAKYTSVAEAFAEQ